MFCTYVTSPAALSLGDCVYKAGWRGGGADKKLHKLFSCVVMLSASGGLQL